MIYRNQMSAATFSLLLTGTMASGTFVGNSIASAFPSDRSCPGNDTRSDRLGRVLPVIPACLPLSDRASRSSVLAQYPPLPEERFEPVAQLELGKQNSTADLTMNATVLNRSETDVTLQVVGETERRTLAAGESLTLEHISLPATVTAARRDRGALDVVALRAKGDRLEVALVADSRLDDTQGVLRVRPDGRVYVN